ncbi:MAG TPA: hypothetical protein VGI40_24935 [Pirellulaceae bacterium]|jgi:hypothetical protein
MGRILVHNSVYVGGAEPQWSPMQATVVLLTCSALVGALWGLLVWLSKRSPAGVSIALALALTIQCTGISIMLAGYLQGGAAALPLSAATVGTVASLCLLTSRPNLRASIGICVVGLGSLLMIGRFFGGLSTEVALILMLAPLLCWGTELPQLRCRPAWVVGSLRLLLVAIPLAALLLQAKRKFDRDTAPLLMHRSEAQEYGGAASPAACVVRLQLLIAGDRSARGRCLCPPIGQHDTSHRASHKLACLARYPEDRFVTADFARPPGFFEADS